MSFNNIVRYQKGFALPAAIITLAVIAIMGVSVMLAVNNFKKSDRQLSVQERCANGTYDPEECAKLEAQQPKSETVKKASVDTSSSVASEITKKLCEEDQGIYIINKEKCDKLLQAAEPAGGTFE